VPVAEPEGPLPFAGPGTRGRLFQYGGDGPGFPVDAPFAVLAVGTTGFSPARGDRIVEVAVVRVDAGGRIEDEYATLVNPGRDVGPVLLHGISTTEVLGAPAFADVAGEVLARLDGAVVVAHNAAVEERFLAAELARIGVALPLNPALCSLWLARRTVRAPDHRLRTLARLAGLPATGAQGALADARTVAALLPQLLAAHGEPLRYLTGLRPMPDLDREVAPTVRSGDLRPGGDGWLASIAGRLPRSVVDAPTADAQRYVDALADALERLLGDDAFAGQCRAGVAALAPSFHWSRVLAPLIAFCSAPRRAPDLVDEDTRRRLASGVGRLYQPRSGLRRELSIAADHLRSGGVRLLVTKAASRVAYATGRKAPPAPQG
jgi:DNA polymerase-3 subunit epsilon